MAMMAYDERRILEMLHEDDISRRRAFEAIVNNFSEQLYWQIRHMVLSHDDANDILQKLATEQSVISARVEHLVAHNRSEKLGEGYRAP